MSWHIAWEIQVMVWDIHKHVLTYCVRNPGPGLRCTHKCLNILHEKSRSWFEIYTKCLDILREKSSSWMEMYTKMSWHIAWEIQVMVCDIHKNVLTYCLRNPGPGLRYTQKCLDILHEKSRSWFEIYTKMSWHIGWEIQVLVWDVHKVVLTYCMRNPGHGLRYTQKCLDIFHEKSKSWFEIYTNMSWHIAWEIQIVVWDVHKNVLTILREKSRSWFEIYTNMGEDWSG
jgi:formylmethanofuran dehydrogenase subunit A